MKKPKSIVGTAEKNSGNILRLSVNPINFTAIVPAITPKTRLPNIIKKAGQVENRFKNCKLNRESSLFIMLPLPFTAENIPRTSITMCRDGKLFKIYLQPEFTYF